MKANKAECVSSGLYSVIVFPTAYKKIKASKVFKVIFLSSAIGVCFKQPKAIFLERLFALSSFPFLQSDLGLHCCFGLFTRQHGV